MLVPDAAVVKGDVRSILQVKVWLACLSSQDHAVRDCDWAEISSLGMLQVCSVSDLSVFDS